MVLFGHQMSKEVAQRMLDRLSRLADSMQISIGISKQRVNPSDPATTFEVVIVYESGESVFMSPTYGSVNMAGTEEIREPLCVIRGTVRVFRTELEEALSDREDTIRTYHKKMLECPA